jgi:hypothetical protein
MNDNRRRDFFQAVVQLDDRAERYLEDVCDIVLKFTDDRAHPTLLYARDVLARRRAIEEPYLRLIAAAGSTSVAAQSAAA